MTTYETPVFNYILRIVGDRTLAEDLTQDVFLRIYHGLAGFSLRCRFTTWLFQVAKNRVLDELRARERRPHPDALDDVAPLEVVDAPPERIEMIDAVWRAVAALNPDLKMALLLRDVVGLSYAEIADSLEITLATVKWRIYKAREEVQLALAREGIDSGAPGSRPLRTTGGAQPPCSSRSRGSPVARRRPSRAASARSGSRPGESRPRSGRGRGAARQREGRRPAAGRPTRIEQPGRPRVEIEHGAVGDQATFEPVVARVIASATWLWPTRTIGRGARSRAASDRIGREHVLPDRVARARVVERGTVHERLRLEALEPAP